MSEIIKMSENVAVTKDLTFAIALTVVGFHIRSVENIVDIKGEKGCRFELDNNHNGVDARDLRSAFYDDEIDLGKRVDQIIEARGITQEEYIFLAFDAARAALRNRRPIIFALSNNKALIAKNIGDGRSLIYREGMEITHKDQLQKIVENS